MGSLGTVSTLRRYPVKSMAGEDVKRVFVAFSGLMGDRVYALVGLSERRNFPWLTARQRPELVRYEPHFVGALDPETQYPRLENLRVCIRAPGAAARTVDEAGLLDLLRVQLECDLELRFSEKGMQDSCPVSLISEGTIGLLEQECGRPLDPRRFRANIYVQWAHREPFFEDSLVGRELRVGDRAVLLVSKKDTRCRIISVDPDTGEVDKGVLDTVMQKHDGCAGVYAVVVREGIVVEGDTVEPA